MRKKKRRIHFFRLLFLLVIITILLLLCIIGVKQLLSINENHENEACLYTKESRIKMNISLNSSKYLLSRYEEENSIIVYASGENDRIYPASLTKLMTMLIVIENTNDFNQKLEVRYRDLEGLYEANASVLGLNVGDTISIKDALYGLILPSGADCALLLKNYIEDNGYDFVELMNQKASLIGMNNTHFSNTTGLFEEDNYTTLYDLKILVDVLYRHSLAREILNTVYYEDDGYVFKSTFYKYQNLLSGDRAYISGGKTGFTLESHLNLFCVIHHENKISFLLLAGADENGEDGKSAHFKDAKNILDYYYGEQ